jgi:tetratricopeptide (TPR) repeat protein
MTARGSNADRLAGAVSLRAGGRDEEARELLLELQRESPGDASINLQCAWVHDKLGLEQEAVPFYEAALAAGLSGEELSDALLGLGSTYRTVGDYQKSLDTLTRGAAEFPEERGFQVFRAMALYNTGRAKEACELLLSVIATTLQEDSIGRYRSAIGIYAEDLDRTWP